MNENPFETMIKDLIETKLNDIKKLLDYFNHELLYPDDNDYDDFYYLKTFEVNLIIDALKKETDRLENFWSDYIKEYIPHKGGVDQ